jgi:hypothetical protein
VCREARHTDADPLLRSKRYALWQAQHHAIMQLAAIMPQVNIDATTSRAQCRQEIALKLAGTDCR